MVEASPVAAALLVVLGAVGAVPVAALADAGVGGQQTAEDGPESNETANESLAPGERFAGVVGVQKADVEGEMQARTFGQRVAAAASNRSAAGVVAAEVDDLDERLADLDAQMQELERARENGTLGEGQYRARLAQLHAEQRGLQRQINQTESVARELPAEALEAKGVNATAIATLRSQAGELSGPEVAAIARSIAGKNAGKGVGGPPERAGPPAFVENRTGGPGAPGNGSASGQGNDGPPENAGPENAGPRNQTGPPEDAGAGNGTGSPEDADADGETRTSENAGPRNETGQASDGTGDGGNGNGTPGGAGSGGANDDAGASEDDGGADGGTTRTLAAPDR